ncbi:MAG: succinate dehydrogenase [Bacteroidales bacterium]|nr:succinate dehydrogenase [Bacteroidales bacterium]MBQ1656821.1 succinate dehydrogenase [Bacteroidales bacterium]MBQ1683312.1 succinate dehydrogenase [Bacteroidales bacterium]MBQ2107711.1 succinate dehydrogenase [Bacteroidales bacterium]MBQ3942163.1 succinate dehydrogenase [Bacteroidales bacterium]
MFIFNSSIGKKFIQAVSGAFLLLFLLLHGTINFFSVIDSFTGKYGVVAADEALFSKGDGLFKLGCDFMSLPIIDIVVPILALGFLVHIGYGCWLTVKNIKARGGIKRYEVSSKAAADSWSAKNMFVLGIIILGLLGFHLTHFWAKMQLPEMFGIGTFENNPYLLLNVTFGKWWVVALYIIWFCAIFLHLTHGFWSMFQTVGWDGKTWFKRVKVIGVIVAALIVLLFVTTAVNAFIQANFLA